MADWEAYIDTFPSTATAAAGTLATGPHSAYHGTLGAAINAALKDLRTTMGDYDTVAKALSAWTSANVINPMSSTFGATGDGSTNDTSAINAALYSLGVLGGGILLFPEGQFNHTGLTIPSNVHLVGAGVGATILHCTAALTNAIDFKGTYGGTSSSAHCKNSGLHAMKITGQATDVGINLEHASSLHLSDFRVDNVAYGLRCYGVWDSVIDGDWRLQECDYGIWIGAHNSDPVVSGTVDSNNLRFFGGTIESCYQTDITITAKGADGNGTGGQKPNAIWFDGLKIESSFVQDATRVLIEGGHAVRFDKPLFSWTDFDTSYSTPVDGVVFSFGSMGCTVTEPSCTDQGNTTIASWFQWNTSDCCQLIRPHFALLGEPGTAHVEFASGTTNRQVAFPTDGQMTASGWVPGKLTIVGVPTSVAAGTLPWSVWLSTEATQAAADANATAINQAIADLVGFDVTAAPTTVASGSNGVALSTFAGSGTLNVVSTTGRFDPNGGTACVVRGYLADASTAVKCEVTYTGITATTLTGVTTTSGSGNLATGDQVYALPTGAGVVELPPSTEDVPFYIADPVIVPDDVHVKGQGFGRTWLKQYEGSNLDAMIAGYYWWHNCSRYLTSTTSSNGQKYVRISDLSLDGYSRDWEHNTTLSAAIADTSTTTISFTSRQTVSGKTIIVDGEFITVPTTASTGSGTIASCTRAAYGSTAAAHSSGAKVAIMRNACTTNARAATIVGDGHGIAIGSPHSTVIENVLIVRPYGHGVFFDSNGKGRAVDVGEGIQWRIENLWVKFPGMDGFHNADAATGKSNINDGHVVNFYFDNVNQLDVNESAAASGNTAYGNVFVGQYVFDANGGATTYQGGHGYGNYAAASNRSAFPGSRAKHGVRVESSAARMSDVMVADFGQASNIISGTATATTFYGFYIRGYHKRGPALVNCKAHCDLDNPLHTKWLARIQTTNAAGTTTPIALTGFNGQVRTDSANTANTTLATTLADGTTTTVVLTSGTGLSAGDVIFIENECIRLGSKSTNTFTGCTRGWAGTAKVDHTSGVDVYLNTVNGIQLNRQTSGAILTGSISGCNVTMVGIPFDGGAAESSDRVAQSGNSWQRAGTVPPTAGTSSKHGFVPLGFAIDNDCSVVTNVARWVCTSANTTDTATFTALTLP